MRSILRRLPQEAVAVEEPVVEALAQAVHLVAPALGAEVFLAQGIQVVWAGLDWKEPAEQSTGAVTPTPAHLEPVGQAVQVLEPSLFA